MKAITIDSYGGPEQLKVSDQPDPKVGPDSVLVRVKAVGVNPVDLGMCRGGLDDRFVCDFPLIPGWDMAGVVEQVGVAVSEFAPGDEVIGYVRMDHVQGGTYAELVSAPVRCLARRPASASWEESAGLPLAGLTAYQAMYKSLRLDRDGALLVHNAAGGVGTIAVQLGAIVGARVVGTASERNHDYVRELGGEPIAYGHGMAERAREAAPDGYTAILDLIGGDALEASPGLLGPHGRLVSIVDAAKVAELGGRYVFVRPDSTDLAVLVQHVEAGRLKVVVSETFPLEKAADAHRLVEDGHVRGKVVLTVD
jgi:NADPH:quinone reductase-like Zn-dependent oxidoreductase